MASFNGESAGPDESVGRITAVRGSVVEATFADGLPLINEALVHASDGRTIVLEVAQHIDLRTVRAIALAPTEGLARGMMVRRTGRPIQVPVGPSALGRLFNVLGEPQ
ncbi:MAG: F0F1 ATP synthase subunit beta, partial [Isosphaeraceae bacterium]